MFSYGSSFSVFKILPPGKFVSSSWKNGGGITHEIARSHPDDKWVWRISIAEVTTDGPFSQFNGMSRILTVIEGKGVDLISSADVITARLLKPVFFSGETEILSNLVNGEIKDLNIIFDHTKIKAEVNLLNGPMIKNIGVGKFGFLALGGRIYVGSQLLKVGEFVLGSNISLNLNTGSYGLWVSLYEKVLSKV